MYSGRDSILSVIEDSLSTWPPNYCRADWMNASHKRLSLNSLLSDKSAFSALVLHDVSQCFPLRQMEC